MDNIKINEWCCRVAPSLGELESTHQEVWGTKDYNYKEDKYKSTVFFGLYDLRDYLSVWRHRGEKAILWAGSDIENLINGFVFNDGKLRLISRLFGGLPKFLMDSIKYDCQHYVEDKDEYQKLERIGIKSRIIPSFLGKISDFPVSYRPSATPNVYISGHQGREDEYGFGLLKEIAIKLPDLIFHIYGGEKQAYKDYPDNVVWHGTIYKEEFNREIKNWQCGLRLNKSDGFSEITAKSVLMGQYPITYLDYPMIPHFKDFDNLIELLSALKDMDKPNYQARDYYFLHLNRYPWSFNYAL